jgi:hypothetical protein
VPSSTDAEIEKIEAEADLRKLARQLRLAIRQHVRMAKTSLNARKLALFKDDLAKEDDLRREDRQESNPGFQV